MWALGSPGAGFRPHLGYLLTGLSSYPEKFQSQGAEGGPATGWDTLGQGGRASASLGLSFLSSSWEFVAPLGRVARQGRSVFTIVLAQEEVRMCWRFLSSWPWASCSTFLSLRFLNSRMENSITKLIGSEWDKEWQEVGTVPGTAGN